MSLKLREQIVKLWVIAEYKGLKAIGYKMYAVGAVFYSFYRLRLLQPLFLRGRILLALIQATVIGIIK